MLVVHIRIRVKAESIPQFIAATLENAKLSLQEPGIARFDVFQDPANPGLFVLSEAYRTPQAPADHKKTAHYLTWRDTVEDMMAEPRTSLPLANIFPADEAF